MTSATSETSPVLSWRAGLLVVLIGVISFSSFIVLSAFAPDLEDKDVAGLHAYSKSALGYNFAVELLKRNGRQVEISRDPLRLNNRYGEDLMVLTPENGRDISDLMEINLDREDPVLIILPKRWGRADPGNRRHQGMVGELNLNSVSAILQAVDDTFGMRRIDAVKEVNMGWGILPVSFKGHTQLITSGPIDPIIRAGDGTLFGRVTGRNIYILADPELMNTHGLANIDNARLAITLFDEMTGSDVYFPVFFDTTLNGFERSRNLLRLLFEPPLLGATLFAFAASLLLGWAAFVRFGKEPVPEPLFATGRASLINSTAGLFNQTNRQHLLADDYGAIVERLTVTGLGYPDDVTPQQIRTILEARLNALHDSGHSIADKPSPGSVQTPGQLVSYARAWHNWKKDISDERQ